MNKLEKFFNTLTSSNPKLLKKYTTEELISQIKEYVDFTPYIVKNIYRLLISQNSDDRINGSEILKSIMFQFKLVTDFKIEYVDHKEEYLCSTGEEFVGKKLSITEQKKLLRQMTDLEHVDTSIVTEIDFKSDSNITIRKQKIQDKPIENVQVFFENLTNNLLNYEWNKRHGAFLAYCAIFNSETNGQVEIKVDSSLFLKIYEILKSDKFTDFVDDRATAPVREAAASLLGGIYPRISKNRIIEEVIKFLDDEDWQTQYSGLLALMNLKDFIIDKKLLCDKLISLLDCRDEDVKYLAADLLINFYDFCDQKMVFKKCLENLKDDEEISVSKVSILSLLNLCKDKISDISILYNYFTSPIPEVRRSVLKLAESIDSDSLSFLFGELILLDEKNDIREEAVSILKKRKKTKDFINHFLRVIGTSLYDPYNENEFVSHDELYFTKSGVKTLGKNIILSNRVELFKLILESENISNHGIISSTAIGDVFLMIYEKFKCINSNLQDENKRCKNIEDDNELINYNHGRFMDIKMLPLKELKNKLETPEKLSLHPLGEGIYIDYMRWASIYHYPNITKNLLDYFKYETCSKFIDFFAELIIKDHDKQIIDLDYFLSESYKNVLLGYENFLAVFKIFGTRIFSTDLYKNILEDPKRFNFFNKTIFFYKPYLNNLKFLYEEAYENNYTEILKGFLESIPFTEDLIDKLIKKMNLDILNPLISSIDHSFYSVLVKPLLNLISSAEHQEIASKLFSYIIPRLNFRVNSEISETWTLRITEAKSNLECLLDSTKIPEYEIKCPSKVTLRKYQADGVKWINFLHTFNLNGILADDMGLGKTIQVLSFICSEIYNTNRKALVVCPSSLTGHWQSEIGKFFPDIKSSCYKRNKNQVFDILIVSYDSFRNDHTYFISENWFYVILDEGHILRNSNTLLYQRMSKLRCTKRLILTGTPVHNSIEDLVNIFNLIMPNYLGSVKEIPYMSSRMSDAEINDIHNRLENLNKQILPFILRRLKIDVLTDLPPKIIRDIIVEMGPDQRSIYKSIEEKGNIDLESINYKAHQNKADGLKRTRDLLNASAHIRYFKESTEISCKMKGLEDIINLCGGDDIRNKILIFFQYKSTIDLVIRDFKTKFNLKYLRLDGSVPAAKRSKIASDFNSGNIPVLFLTTLIGGLGLNLTGADTVIFYEHDWNPFNDLQAMDRAHRIGQKNTVNVFRLIAKDSIEEKVMDLQSFKVFIASSVVSQQNADIETMDTKDLLERFGK
jgi:TATA-binding protein-associated factor